MALARCRTDRDAMSAAGKVHQQRLDAFVQINQQNDTQLGEHEMDAPENRDVDLTRGPRE